MTNTLTHRRSGERGAVLIQVTVAILGILAFSALAIDYGVMWASRREAQNAADAGALAGATSLAFDAPGNYDRARAMAETTGEVNKVFGGTLDITRGIGNSVDPAQDISFPNPCPPGAPGLPDTCVRVNVYRNDVKDELPTFMAHLFGRFAQGVKATATAQVLTGNASDCIKPWAVADKWQEKVECANAYKQNGECNNNQYIASDTWDTTKTFDKYLKDGGNGMIVNPGIAAPLLPDEYIPPDEDSPGTGFMPFDPATGLPTLDYGLQISLKIGSSENRISSGWFMALDLPGCETGDSGANCYRWNIKNCNPTVWAIGDELEIASEQGNMVGPTSQGVTGQGGPDQEIPGLIEKDPNAKWDPCATGGPDACAPGIIDSCVGTEGGLCPAGINGTAVFMTQSPRIVPIPLFDVDSFFEGSPNGQTSVTITNIAGFFIEGMGGQGGKDVVGRLLTYPGLTKGTSSVDESASYLRQVILVR